MAVIVRRSVLGMGHVGATPAEAAEVAAPPEVVAPAPPPARKAQPRAGPQARHTGIIIDAGMSHRGASFYGRVLRCPTDWAGAMLLKRKHSSRAQRLGTLMHAANAQHYARLMCVQQGWNVDDYLPPEDTIARIIMREDRPFLEAGAWAPWDELRKDACALHRRYVEDKVIRRFDDTHEVIAVEEAVSMWVDHTGIVDPPADADARLDVIERGDDPEAILESTEGPPFYYTARLDLVVRDRSGFYDIPDYKSASRISRVLKDSYAIDLQFLGLRHLGEEAYGTDMGRVLIAFINAREVELWPVPIGRRAYKRFGQQVCHATAIVHGMVKHWIRRRAEGTDPNVIVEDFRAVHNGIVCHHRYGECGMRSWCWGD
jgi:hypothetical protein